MDKALAIEKLDTLIQQLVNLPSYQVRGANTDFQKWYRATNIALEHIFGLEAKQVEAFCSVRYRLWTISNRTTAAEFMDAHNKGRLSVKSLLESFINEIEEYGLIEDLDKSLNEVQIIEKLLINFHRFARQLLIRHSNRSTLEINDEYDVQDLLHSILKLHFDDVRAEISTPSYAGSNSRMDFYLKDHDIIIEIKKTRSNLKDKEIGEELLVDIARYQQSFPKMKLLICFVYDPDGLIRNPIGLENDLMKTPSNIEIKAIICPRF